MAWTFHSGPTKNPDGTITREHFTIKWPLAKSSGTDAMHPPLSAWLAVLVAAIAILSVLAILGLQVLAWANSGRWPSVSLGDFIAVVMPGTSIASWVSTPESWFGLHQVVMEIPLIVWIMLLWWIVDRRLKY